jgi:acid phosphatase type 7
VISTIIASVLTALGVVRVDSVPSPFLVKPYLQIGDTPAAADPATMTLMFHTDTMKAAWEVETRPTGGAHWIIMRTFGPGRVAAPGFPPHDVYSGTLGSFAPGSAFEYRVKKNGAVVFTGHGHARPPHDQPFRVVAFGDCGWNGDGQKAIAYRAFLQHPDFVAITGDIVYSAGRMSEYRTNFFPVYNADSAAADRGAPLMRQMPFVAALGNHDAGYVDAGETVHDQWGYFAYWDLPLNGPVTKKGRNAPILAGDSAYSSSRDSSISDTLSQQSYQFFRRWPTMANYSFDWGNTHWLVLDANVYVDWTDARLRNWVAQDLAGATQATWKIVMFHQPSFNSSRAHFGEEQMRLLSDVFEAGGVDLVLSGHVHNYQRSYPLTFLPRLAGDPKIGDDGVLHAPDWYIKHYVPYTIDGRFTIDHQFDGVRRTVPKGIIYIVTGAGAGLYDPPQTGERASWQPFTERLIADRLSLSVIDVKGRTLTFRQLDEQGAELDHFVMTKRIPTTISLR